MLVPDDKLDLAASALPWIAFTSPLPAPHAWQSGWEVVAKVGRRFRHPAKYNPRTIELLILPPLSLVLTPIRSSAHPHLFPPRTTFGAPPPNCSL